MKAREKNIQQQIQFWALIGPFISILTLLVSLMKSSPIDQGFALAMIIGVPLCWKWKLRGLAISLGILFGVVAYHYIDLDIPGRLWVGGVTSAASLSFLVTALSFEEVTSLLTSMEVESKSRLDNLLQLDEKLKHSEKSHSQAYNQLQSKLEDFELDLARHKDRAEASEKLAHVVREELASTHSKNNEVQEELFEWRHKYAQANRKIEELHEEINILSKASAGKVNESEDYKKLEVNLSQSLEKISSLESELMLSKEQQSTSEALFEEQSQELRKTGEELEKARQLLQESQEECAKVKESLSEHSGKDDYIQTLKQTVDEQSLSLNETKEELATVRQLLQESQEECAKVKESLSEHSGKDDYIHTLKQTVDEQSLSLNETKEELATVRQLLQESQEECAKVKESLSEHSVKDECIGKLKLTVEEKEQEIIVDKQKIDDMQRTFSEKELVFQKLIQEGKATIQSLTEEKKAIADQLEKLQAENPVKAASKKESSEVRKIKGKYNQL
ncbi:MAG: hypothetical protein VX777_09810, partial [Chlamydiota bacterium]|nr:hypothetical protein [Chlamydiota bacterium]